MYLRHSMRLRDFSDCAHIAILDDNREEGEGIKRALESVNIPSLFYDLNGIRRLRNPPSKNIRLVFLDLLFADSKSSEPAQNAANALSKLHRVVGAAAFYILVIWSSHTTEEVATVFIKQLQRQDEFAKPSKVLTLEKTGFKSARGRFELSPMVAAINKLLDKAPLLRIFTEWERVATNTISYVAGDVVGQKDHDSLSKTINSLSSAYAGKCRARDVPQNALMALNDIFRGQLSAETTSRGFGELYKRINSGLLSADESAKLNATLMFTPDKHVGPGSLYVISLAGKRRSQYIATIVEQTADTLGAAYSKISPVSVDITPLCNAAQNSGKFRYFLEGLIHPSRYTKQGGKKAPITIKRGYCCQLGGEFWDSKREVVSRLSFNLKLYHTKALPKSYKTLDMRLRDNLVVDLQHQVASYVSRPGHVLLAAE